MYNVLMDRESKLIKDLYWENKFLNRMLARYKKKCKYLQRELKKRNREMSKPRRVLNDNGSVSYLQKEEFPKSSPKKNEPKDEKPVIEVKPMTEKELLTMEAKELGIKVKRNWGVKKLLSAIAEETGEEEEDL